VYLLKPPGATVALNWAKEAVFQMSQDMYKIIGAPNTLKGTSKMLEVGYM
jgi:hypothetical protein